MSSSILRHGSASGELANHTIVVPTYNRPGLLQQLTAHYARQVPELRLLVLDSSLPEMASQNAAAVVGTGRAVQHIAFPTTTPMAEKLGQGLAHVTTPTVSFCADDDLVFIDGLVRARKFLLDHRDYVCAHGLYINFRVDGLKIHVGREYVGGSIDAGHPGARIFRLCQNYESLFYGTFRTSDLQQIFAEVARHPSLLLQELCQSVGAVIKGKVERLPCFYAARRSGPEAEPTRDKWQTQYWFADNPTELLQHYAAYRTRVAAFYATHGADPRLEEKDFLKVLDIAHAIYFSKGCSPAYFHRQLQGYWPDDSFVGEPLDLFRAVRHGNRALKVAASERLLMRVLRKLRRLARRGGTPPSGWDDAVASLDRTVQAAGRQRWQAHLPGQLAWLAANDDFRGAYGELCSYLDREPSR